MKKFLSLMLVITLVFSLSSCGKPKEIKELEELTKALSKIGTEEGTKALNEIADSLDDDYSYDDEDYSYDDDYSYGDNNYGISGEPGSELSDFYTIYENAISTFEGPINDWETDDFFMFDAAMDYLTPSLHFLTMSLYDLLEIFGNDEGEYKEVKGNIIEFGKEYTREEDGFSPADKKGDVYVEKGVLDNSAKTLLFESYSERDGGKLSRAVTEVEFLSDGTFIVQTLRKNALFDDRLEDKGDAYFMVFDSNRLEIIRAKFSPDVNFSYNSIIGKGKITPQDMAQGYTLVRKLTVADGVATVEKYE
ncbi:MAG: hypothetical protein EWM47_10010 [Anaerolineaceae bacterium]|nr:MAG: hypothetical protein EWM47_10010 [Anaerolineaceae bacterium]